MKIKYLKRERESKRRIYLIQPKSTSIGGAKAAFGSM